MKKILLLFISVVLISTFALSSCKQQAHVHEWKDATCLTPKTCVTCGETEGTALGHKWQEATCLTPKICMVCGKTEGTALGHKWQDYTCTVCGAIDITKKDKAKGHDAIELLSSSKDSCDYMSSIIAKAWHFSIYEYESYYTLSNDDTITGFSKYIGIKKDVAKTAIDSLFKRYGYDTSNYVIYLGVSSIAVSCVEEMFVQSGLTDSLEQDLSIAAGYIKEMTDNNNNGKQEVWNYYVSVKSYIEFCFSPSGSYANLASTLSSYQNECRKASLVCERYF